MSDESGEIYVLEYPVEFAGQTTTELKFQTRIKMKHLRGLTIREAMTWDEAMTIAGRLCGQPDLFMAELGLSDGQNIWLLVSSFLASSPTTGKTP